MVSAAVSDKPQAPSQNWVLGPALDILFIIAAPLIALVWAGATFLTYGSLVVLAIFGVFNVAHHFPTFIRIYGDQDLMKRFRWSLLLAPVIPFTFFMVVVALLVRTGLPVDAAIFLFIITAIWDPWHFLMQHYGFVRIYDRHNKAPHKLAARMDSLICWTWFIYIMFAAVDWFPSILYDFYNRHRLMLLYAFDSGVYPVLNQVAFVVALAATAVYIGYLIWCIRRGFYVSYAKLLLVVITFAVMYLTYVPNPLMRRMIPEWNFALGFATLGMVHVTQYLAIVWKYNRGLASREDRARPGWFRSAFAKGGLAVVATYVIGCLLYGFLVSGEGLAAITLGAQRLLPASVIPWLAGVLMALGFTSTLLHYYYDGFIWKMREKENRQNLALQDNDASSKRKKKAAEPSWWDTFRQSAFRVFWRQGMYFGLPMALLAGSFLLVQAYPAPSPADMLNGAYEAREQGQTDEMESRIAVAFAEIDDRVELERRMIEIRPRATHYENMGELLYLKAKAKKLLLAEATPESRRADLRAAIDAFENALACPVSKLEEKRKAEIREALIAWRDELRKDA